MKFSNDAAGLLGYPIRRGHQMRGQGNGRHAGVGDANIRKAVHEEICIDYAAQFAGEHCAGGRRMEFGAGELAQPVQPLGIGLDGWPRRRFACEATCQRIRFAEATGEFETVEEDLVICYMSVMDRIVGVDKTRKHTSRVIQIVRINNRVFHWICGLDVDTAVAVWVLQSGSDTDVAVAITIHEQEFDLTCRAIEYLRCRRLTNLLVSSGDGSIVRLFRFILVNSSKDLFLVLIDLIPVHGSGVHVGNSIVDIC